MKPIVVSAKHGIIDAHDVVFRIYLVWHPESGCGMCGMSRIYVTRLDDPLPIGHNVEFLGFLRPGRAIRYRVTNKEGADCCTFSTLYTDFQNVSDRDEEVEEDIFFIITDSPEFLYDDEDYARRGVCEYANESREQKKELEMLKAIAKFGLSKSSDVIYTTIDRPNYQILHGKDDTTRIIGRVRTDTYVPVSQFPQVTISDLPTDGTHDRIEFFTYWEASNIVCPSEEIDIDSMV